MNHLEQKWVDMLRVYMAKAKNQDQADIAYAMIIRQAINMYFSMNTLREMTFIYENWNK